MAQQVGGRRQRRRAAREDKRFRVVGVLGELLVTLGVLVALFVVWQLWWTDVEAEARQTEMVAALDWAPPQQDAEPQPRRDDPPVEAEVQYLDTFATLAIPRFGDDYERTVTSGVTRPEVLDELGIGHFPGTAMPGQVGNFALAGHRVTYGKPFNQIAELRAGDPLIVRTEQAWYVYRVTDSAIVQPTQVEVIAPVPWQPGAEPDQRLITLTACHPMFSAAERYVVFGELDYWLPADGPAPAELDEEPADLPALVPSQGGA